MAENAVVEVKPPVEVAPKPSAGGASSGGGYEVSGDLRNPPITIPRVSGNTQVTISRGKVNGPFIAMTFDDGPHPRNTPRLLEMLRQRNIKATFYVVGTNSKRYPDMLREMVAEGHEIGNHTVNHLGLSRLSADKIRRELGGAHEAVLSATGVPPTTVRPPYGSVTKAQKQWIFDEFGYTTVLWSVDPRDWQRPGVSVVARRIVEGARNGSIILAHDIHKPTIDAMPSALDELLRRGYRFVTVSQLMAMQGAAAVGPPMVSENEFEMDDAELFAGLDELAPTEMEPVVFGPPRPGEI